MANSSVKCFRSIRRINDGNCVIGTLVSRSTCTIAAQLSSIRSGNNDASSARSGDAGAGDSGVGRARSLTDDDLEELKGCVDLGFGFSYNEIPELCGTLPALELCYSMSQRFLDEHQPPSKVEDLAPEPPAVVPPPPAQPIPNWKISCPGDSPDEVKARLKYWAQAVACTVKLCS
ncbi:hypothetical protein TRIUR3_09123 [Triticum urartu]|uniref:Uncharacterized protein n=1 Tax=Triticum urartu TaxID=4572 RepID=M7Z6R7_TRIUA|nr:hypothetical protein TRIUR3_09123 [Triticum urartu]